MVQKRTLYLFFDCDVRWRVEGVYHVLTRIHVVGVPSETYGLPCNRIAFVSFGGWRIKHAVVVLQVFSPCLFTPCQAVK